VVYFEDEGEGREHGVVVVVVVMMMMMTTTKMIKGSFIFML
jgi:hypothetical protein